MARVQFGGIVKEVNLAYTPEAKVDDYVMVHVGFALSMVDEAEARLVFQYLEQMDELAEIQSSSGIIPEVTKKSEEPNTGNGAPTDR